MRACCAVARVVDHERAASQLIEANRVRGCAAGIELSDLTAIGHRPESRRVDSEAAATGPNHLVGRSLAACAVFNEPGNRGGIRRSGAICPFIPPPPAFTPSVPPLLTLTVPVAGMALVFAN